MIETLDFASDKCERQGHFLAGVADYMMNNFDKANEVEMVVMNEVNNFLIQEVEIMKQRIKKFRESASGN